MYKIYLHIIIQEKQRFFNDNNLQAHLINKESWIILLKRFYTAKAHDKNIIYTKNEGYLPQMGVYFL